jgi:hypothetical protein
MPNDLNSEIHSNFSSSSSTWSNFRSEVTGMYILSGQNGEGGRQHLLREYNRKIDELNQSGQFYLEPFNGGFSYLGTPDLYTGAAGAYSTRTIGFGGPLMRIRRNSDNTEVDVRGDTNGNISLDSPLIATGTTAVTTNLKGFIGTASGYCSIWYDQSATGDARNNLTQTTAADQPMLVNGGALITDSSGNAALDFDGSDHHMTLNTGFSSTLNINALSSYLVFEADTTAGTQMVSCLGSFADSNKRWYFPFITSSNFSFNYGAGSAPSTSANTNLNLVSMVADSTQGAYKAFLNSSQVGSDGSLEDKSGGTSLVGVGGLGNSLHYNGKMGEFIIYSSSTESANRTSIETDIKNHFKI